MSRSAVPVAAAAAGLLLALVRVLLLPASNKIDNIDYVHAWSNILRLTLDFR
jgi:hypothetical protein